LFIWYGISSASGVNKAAASFGARRSKVNVNKIEKEANRLIEFSCSFLALF